jgi:TetR/AcrR family transcriptional repressor of nem operon
MSYTKKALATRKRIIDTASQLFFTKGFSRTKLDEILLIAKVRKGNFYYYFRSKDDLGLAVIRESGRPLVVEWVRSLIDPQADPRDNLAQLAERLVTSEQVLSGQGNPLTNLALEMSSLSDDFRRELDVIMSEVANVFAEQLTRLQERGNYELAASPKQAAWFLVSMLEGALLMYRLNKNEQQLRFNIDYALTSVVRVQPIARAS